MHINSTNTGKHFYLNRKTHFNGIFMVFCLSNQINGKPENNYWFLPIECFVIETIFTEEDSIIISFTYSIIIKFQIRLIRVRRVFFSCFYLFFFFFLVFVFILFLSNMFLFKTLLVRFGLAFSYLYEKQSRLQY